MRQASGSQQNSLKHTCPRILLDMLEKYRLQAPSSEGSPSVLTAMRNISYLCNCTSLYREFSPKANDAASDWPTPKMDRRKAIHEETCSLRSKFNKETLHTFLIPSSISIAKIEISNWTFWNSHFNRFSTSQGSESVSQSFGVLLQLSKMK